jgi:hypothetical protein
VTLADDFERVAAAAGAFAQEDEKLDAVLAAQPTQGGRVYLCAFRRGDEVSWLAVDDAGEPVTDRERVREAASLVALSELAEESAGGGELDDLLSRLVAVRLTESPEGIDEAEEAVRNLQHVLGAQPRVATAAYVDEVGAATKRLEDALGSPGSSPFAEAMKASAGAVQAFTTDVESNYKEPLR